LRIKVFALPLWHVRFRFANTSLLVNRPITQVSMKVHKLWSMLVGVASAAAFAAQPGEHDDSAGLMHVLAPVRQSTSTFVPRAAVQQAMLATDWDFVHHRLLAYYLGEDSMLYQLTWPWPAEPERVHRPALARGSSFISYQNTIYGDSESFYLTEVQGAQHVEQLWGAGLSPTDLSSLITTRHPAQPAADALPGAQLVGFIDDCVRTDNVAYIGADHHVHLLTWAPDPGWTAEDLTRLAQGVAVRGTRLVGHVTDAGEEAVFHVDSAGLIHELWRWSGCTGRPAYGGWHDVVISSANGNDAPRAQSASALAGFAEAKSGKEAIFYTDLRGHLHELYSRGMASLVTTAPSTPAWAHLDVTQSAGSAAPAADSPLAAQVDTTSHSQDLYFLDVDNNVRLVTAPAGSQQWTEVSAAAPVNVQARTCEGTLGAPPPAARGAPLAADINGIAKTDELYYIGDSGQPYELWRDNGIWRCVAIVRTAHGIPSVSAAADAQIKQPQPSANAGGQSVLSKLEADTGVPWIALQPGNLAPQRELPPASFTPSSDSKEAAVSAALDFLVRYHDIWRITDAKREFRLRRYDASPTTLTLHFDQFADSLPVFGGGIIVNFDTQGRIEGISGHYVPDLDKLDKKPRLTAPQAAAAAQMDLARQANVPINSIIVVKDPVLGIVVTPPIGPNSIARLAYRLVVAGAPLRELEYEVDAATGAVISSTSMTVS
jgi:hypothetical protein